MADTSDAKVTVPLWLKMTWSVALFPVDLIEFIMAKIGFGFFGISSNDDRLGGALFCFLTFINSIFWAHILYFLFRRKKVIDPSQ